MRDTTKLLGTFAALGILAYAGTSHAQWGGVKVGGVSVAPPRTNFQPPKMNFNPGQVVSGVSNAAANVDPNVRGNRTNTVLNNALDYGKDRYPKTRPSTPSTLMPVPDGPTAGRPGRPSSGGSIQFDPGEQRRPLPNPAYSQQIRVAEERRRAAEAERATAIARQQVYQDQYRVAREQNRTLQQQNQLLQNRQYQQQQQTAAIFGGVGALIDGVARNIPQQPQYQPQEYQPAQYQQPYNQQQQFQPSPAQYPQRGWR